MAPRCSRRLSRRSSLNVEPAREDAPDPHALGASSPELFARGEAEFGPGGLSELITLVGYYELLALSLRVWRTPLPPGAVVAGITKFATSSIALGKPEGVHLVASCQLALAAASVLL